MRTERRVKWDKGLTGNNVGARNCLRNEGRLRRGYRVFLPGSTCLLYGGPSGGPEAKKGQLGLKGTVESLGRGGSAQDFLQWSGQRRGKSH